MTLTIITILVIAIFGLLALFERGYRRRLTERAEGYRKAASLRGWTMEIGKMQVLRYSGTTEGLPWTFDTFLRGTQKGELRYAPRWETAAVRSDEVILVWPAYTQSKLRADIPERVSVARILGIEPSLLSTAREDRAMKAALGEEKIVAAVVFPAGMRVVFPTLVSEPEEVERMIKICMRMARTRTPSPVF